MLALSKAMYVLATALRRLPGVNGSTSSTNASVGNGDVDVVLEAAVEMSPDVTTVVLSGDNVWLPEVVVVLEAAVEISLDVTIVVLSGDIVWLPELVVTVEVACEVDMDRDISEDVETVEVNVEDSPEVVTTAIVEAVDDTTSSDFEDVSRRVALNVVWNSEVIDDAGVMPASADVEDKVGDDDGTTPVVEDENEASGPVTEEPLVAEVVLNEERKEEVVVALESIVVDTVTKLLVVLVPGSILPVEVVDKLAGASRTRKTGVAHDSGSV